MIFNLFCDASIDIDVKIACAGCFITCQDDSNNITDIGMRRIIQPKATNNSAEILAIWIGVTEALKLRNQYPNAIFRLFSDSKISLYGMRDWIKNWIRNSPTESLLISPSSGEPVKNQQRFIDIYNIIVENGLRIEFYHQRGHVGSKVNMNIARSSFIKANKVSPEALGLNIEYLSKCNDIVDNATRKPIVDYKIGNTLEPDVIVELGVPFEYDIRSTMVHQYIRNINKTSVASRHDFKGGYNQ